jgi:methyl-accepting chemotaxis protein
MKFRDLKIGTKIMTGFGLVALITLVVGIIGYTGLNRVADSFHDVADVRLPSIEALQELEIAYEMVHVVHRTLLIPDLSADERARQFKNLEKAREKQSEALTKYEALPQTVEEAKKWQDFLSRRQERRRINQEIEALVEEIAKIDIHYHMELLKNLERFKGDH